MDVDALIRDRAYALWEHAGRPTGLEHEHWAEARRQIEAEVAQDGRNAADPIATHGAEASDSSPQEASRLRQALYAPEPFSFELFGSECPKIDRPIVLRPDNTSRPSSTVTRSAA